MSLARTVASIIMNIMTVHTFTDSAQSESSELGATNVQFI